MIRLLVSRVVVKAWDEAEHPREPAGSPTGGQFTETNGTGGEKSLPSRDDPLPTWVYKINPALFENNLLGCEIGSSTSYGWVDTRMGHTPYEAMDRFAENYGDGREAERVFGKTPINRFIFKFKNGVNYYGIRADERYGSNRCHIYESGSTFERGRGKNKNPFWSDVT